MTGFWVAKADRRHSVHGKIPCSALTKITNVAFRFGAVLDTCCCRIGALVAGLAGASTGIEMAASEAGQYHAGAHGHGGACGLSPLDTGFDR